MTLSLPLSLGRPLHGRTTFKWARVAARVNFTGAVRSFSPGRPSENETRMHYTWIAGDINFLPRTWSWRAAAAAAALPEPTTRLCVAHTGGEGKLAGAHTRLRAAAPANFFSRGDFDEWQRGAPRGIRRRGAPEGFPEELADKLGDAEEGSLCADGRLSIASPISNDCRRISCSIGYKFIYAIAKAVFREI